ncbi:aminophospholipid transmembrane transporter [Aureococcus anophagefferens]|nr:aminophospholipid transmembrane transporter [Aureococcus anophagefferens]
MADAPKTKSRRPPAGKFYQQEMAAWQPTLTPGNVITTFAVLGAGCIVVGVLILYATSSVVQVKAHYDGPDAPGAHEACRVSGLGQTASCAVTMKAPEKMAAPIYVYDELGNVYQNHKRYSTSLSHEQLMGSILEKDELSACEPLKTSGDRTLSPCGLLANSFFSDTFTVSSPAGLEMKEEKIAWWSDRSHKFIQPDTFEYRTGIPEADVEGCLNAPPYDTKTPCADSRPDKFQYLYETYPDNISPLVGVEDEHFMVHMRTAALPHFRKLYGKISTDVEKGESVTFAVESRFWVRKFGGDKYLTMTTLSNFGGADHFTSVAYIVVGVICCAVALLFVGLQQVQPRVIGDLSAAVENRKAK